MSETAAKKPRVVAKKAPVEKVAEAKAGKMVAVVRIRGEINILTRIQDTLYMLNLYKRNFCVVYDATPSVMGMIRKCKDYVTWGEISEETFKALQKRAEKDYNEPGKNKKFYRLNSPKKGYGRKGIKTPFVSGGALGYRGEKMNDLIMRML